LSSSEPRIPALQVLWVIRTLPFPQTSGDRVYSAQFIRAVAAAGAEVTVLGLATGTPPEAGFEEIHWMPVEAAPRPSLAAAAMGLPLVAARNSPAPFREALRTALRRQRPDLLVLDSYAAGWALDELGSDAPPICYVAHNWEEQTTRDIAREFRGPLAKGAFLKLNAARTRRLERRMVERARLVVALTESDRGNLLRTLPGKPAVLIPPGYVGESRASRVIGGDVPRRLVMLGSVQWIAKQMNLAAFLRMADPAFAAAGITLDIVGDVAAALQREWVQKLRATRFLGFVDDVNAVLDQARMGLLIDTLGGGFKLKVLSYLQARTPVAALGGSFEGIPEPVARHFLVAPDAERLVPAIVAAIDDLPRLNAMQEAAFAAAQGQFDWRENGRRFVAAARAALARDQSGR
jgi:glycosyltransferase involved in cell wall biosynthesis